MGAVLYDNHGVRLGTTPDIYERVFARQRWTDETIYYDENKKKYELDKKETFVAILSKEGYKRQLITIPYSFAGKPEITRRWFLLNE